MEKEKITFEQFCDPEYRRSLQMKIKSEAIWVVFHELGGLINVSRLARDYFNKSQGWLVQKINGYSVSGRNRSFNEEESKELTKALRDIADRLSGYADEIDNAKYE